MRPIYDTIGRGYAVTRRADPRIAEMIRASLGQVSTVVNVGAGAGSYEPADLNVVAVEPSMEMIRQRPAGAAPVIQGMAEQLPFHDASFDAALAILTVHHWKAQASGLAELGRVARQRVVVLTWDPACRDAFWLTARYLPEIVHLDVQRFPPMEEFARRLGNIHAEPLPMPHDCQDGFLGAFWRRPEVYLDPHVYRRDVWLRSTRPWHRPGWPHAFGR